jgi:hypothetical protein
VKDQLEIFASGFNILAPVSKHEGRFIDPATGLATDGKFEGHQEHPLGNFVKARFLAGAAWRF